MGIRFYCPNGHRLNVKSFQAGKRGICPRCSARFRIPEESEVAEDAPKFRPYNQAIHAQPETVTALDSATFVAPSASPSDAVAEAVSCSVELEPDPIAETPDAVWYVQPPSGGQYGPAQGDVMRRWLAEGRVSADSLVWREGWTEWRAAGALFPSLSNDAVTPSSSPKASAGVQVQPEPHGPSLRRSKGTRKRPSPSRSRSIAIVVTLVSLVVVLLITLVLVLRGMP